MGEKLRADAQYNDLLGDSAADGHIGSPLIELGELVNVPETHRVAGVSLYFGSGDEVQLHACACLKSEYQKMKSARKIEGERFMEFVPVDSVLDTLKRFSITLREKDLSNIDIEFKD